MYTRFRYDTRPAYCWDQPSRKRNVKKDGEFKAREMNVKDVIISM